MPSCCISHEFLISATKDPCRVAIVHADGGLQIFRESRAKVNGPSSSSFTPASISSFDLNFDAYRISTSSRLFPGDECFTYEELLSAVDSLSRRIRCVLDGGDTAHFLNHPGFFHISPEGLNLEELDGFGLPSLSYMPHIVGVQIGPSVEYIVAVLSILRCGEAFLPLDPSWPEERILSIISSSRTRLVIQVKADSTMKCRGRQMDGGGDDWVVGERGSVVLYFSMKEKFVKNVAQVTNLVWPCESNRLRKFCYLMYTSGSTGEPKGVCGTELGLLNRFWWMQDQYPISQEDVLLFKTSVSFVDHLQEFLGAILACALLVIPPYHELKYPEFAVDILKAYAISRLTTVPSLVRELLPSFDISQSAQLFNSLKVMVLSGEVFPISLWRDLHDHLPETTILNLYGSTEVAGDCACFDCNKMPNILEAEQLSSVPIGKPISNCEIDLLGERSKDNVGEICVSGMCLFAGYIGEVPLRKLLKDNCTRLQFKTGDSAKRLPSGDFVFLGRKDRIVKVRGQRISLEEIENVLREHPDIRDAAVIVQNTNGDCCHIEAFFIVRATDERSEGDITCVNRHDNEELIASIKRLLLRKLPSAMLPTVFVRTEMFPKSSSGKVDYSMLRSSAYAPKRLRGEYERNISDSHHFQVIKKARCMLYIATTSGVVSGVSLEVSPFSILWRFEADTPLFGSLCLDSSSGNVVCCLVNGSVMALNTKGHTVWKVSVGGPIFAGACISFSLPSQVLVCCRNGGLYSVDMENGALLWEYQTGDPITASAYVDELSCAIAKSSHPCHRLVCICSSSGRIHVLRVHPNAKQERAAGVPGNQLVEEFAIMNLPGDTFSSPVMIAGRIFVGCRDDFVHCVAVKT